MSKSMSIYCRGDRSYHYKSELPQSLRIFVHHVFPSGPYVDNVFKSFSRKYYNALKKLLPEGYKIHNWYPGHFEFSFVIENPEGKYIYLSIDDVRFFPNEWFSNILIRTMAHDKDWHGGTNRYTTLFTLNEDIKKLIWR